MRDILFRGKRKNGNEWVYGNYCGAEYLSSSGIEHLIIEIPRTGCSAQIDPETIGQYTGLTDKNGTKIFEGDICSKFSNYSGKRIVFPIVFELGLFYAKYSENAGIPLCDICEKIEIIGNIHDNPELLKGGDKT